MAGGDTAITIAKWNGTNWAPLGSGLNGGPNGLTVYNNDLIVGGTFTTAGGINANYIAKWGTPYGIKNINAEIPEYFSLSQNYPNPFNPNTKIQFALPQKSFTKLIVYDYLGREITTLVNEQLNAGIYEADFDGSNLSSGVYYYRLTAGDFIETKKMILVK